MDICFYICCCAETKFHQLEKDLRVALQHLKKAESENEILGRETTARGIHLH